VPAGQTADGEATGGKKVVRLDVTLKELSWNVPGYGNIQTMRTMSEVGFGMLGAVARTAYESSNTVPVQGRAVILVRLADVPGQESVLDKTYMGTATENRSIAECDTFQTQSHIVGAATAEALRQLRRDLPASLTPLPAATAPLSS
jgi:hypothetical protein